MPRKHVYFGQRIVLTSAEMGDKQRRAIRVTKETKPLPNPRAAAWRAQRRHSAVAFSELIKDFERIREYMRQFYVYGFKSRSEYDLKSARSYDNERRRMDSWLSGYMSFRQDAAGKNVYLSVDSRNVTAAPSRTSWPAATPRPLKTRSCRTSPPYAKS